MTQILRAGNVFVRFISLLYNQLLQYTLLKSLIVPSALLTKFPKKFHKKLLASTFIFTKLSTTTLIRRSHVSFEYQGLCKTPPRRSYCFLSMFKLRCKRHYRNLAKKQLVYNMNTSRKRRRRDADIWSAAAARRHTALFTTGVKYATIELATQRWL